MHAWAHPAPGSPSAAGQRVPDARTLEAEWSCLRQAVGLPVVAGHDALEAEWACLRQAVQLPVGGGHDHLVEPFWPPDLYFGPDFRRAAAGGSQSVEAEHAPERVRVPGRPRATRSAPAPPVPPAPVSSASRDTLSAASAHPRSILTQPADNMRHLRDDGVSLARRTASGTAEPHSAPAAQSCEDRQRGVSFAESESGIAEPHSAPAAQSYEDRLRGMSFIVRASDVRTVDVVDVGGGQMTCDIQYTSQVLGRAS